MSRPDLSPAARPGAAALLTLAAALAGAAATAQESNKAPYPALGHVEVLDDRMKDLIPEDAAIEILASGFEWSEGPAWWPEKQSLLFSDIPRNTVFLWNEDGGVVPFLKPSGYTGTAEFNGVEPGSNGLAFDAQGRLVLCQHGDRRVARLKVDGKSFETVVDAYGGKRLNSPNDLVIASDGSVYFTDPPYGLPKNVDDPAKELPYQGIYRLTPDGALTLLTDEMSRPNGIGLSPDEKTLYVANSDNDRPVWMAFPIQEDGTLGEGKELADARDQIGKAPGSCDGMAVDAQGNLFATGPGGVWVIAPDGTHLGTLYTGERTANCTFGGPDGSTLFLTADMYLCRIATKTKGINAGD